MKIQAQSNAVLLQYKEHGKIYDQGTSEAGAVAHPFEEVTVQAGESFELPEGATLIAKRELGSAPQQGGTPD